MWNIADGYVHFGRDYEHYDDIVMGLVAQKQWKFHKPVQRFEELVFTDCGAAYLGGYKSAGASTQGFLYVMQKL